jgi:hypothetical protein
MSDAAKKIIWAAAGSIPSAILAVVLRKVFQVWGIFDPFSEWLGGWLKMHVSTAQVEWTIAGVIAIAGYAVMLRILWRHIQPIADASLSTNLPQSQRDIKVSAAETQQLERIGSPLQIEFGNDDRHERTQHFNDICIVRKTIYSMEVWATFMIVTLSLLPQLHGQTQATIRVNFLYI